MRVKEEGKKAVLKLNIQKLKIIASSPITSWKIDVEKVETVTDFIFLGSKITVDSDCIHEIKRCLLLGRKAITNLDNVLKSRDITLPTKVHIVKTTGFSRSHVWMWELELKEGWELKNWCFELPCWRRHLKSPLYNKEVKRVNPKTKSTLNIHWKDRCWSWNSNTLANWCKQPTHWKRPWCWEKLKARGEGDYRWQDCWMASPNQWIWVWANSGRWWRTEKPGVLQFMGSKRVGHGLVTQQQRGKYLSSVTSWWHRALCSQSGRCQPMSVASLLTVLAVCLYIQTEQALIILTPTKI